MKFRKALCTASAAIALTGCALSVNPWSEGPNPLLEASCPELTPLTESSYAATSTKLLEVATRYRQCREAALAR